METMTKEQYKEKRENLDCKIREQIQQVNQELESLRAAANTDYSVDDENVKDILDEAEVDLDNIKSCISSVEDALEELQELKESRESLDDDFAIILGIDITLLHGNAFVKVTKHLLDLWGKEFAEVKAIAEMNDRKLPIQKIGMSDIIPCEEDMFFEVNNGRGNGAIIAYLFEDELKKLAKEHDGLYVSFSSIDTLMIFPNDRIPCGDKEIILKELTEVVLQANDEMPENLLGTKAYYFDPEHGFEF